MKQFIFFSAITFGILGSCTSVVAAPRISIEGRQSIVVTQPEIKLADIAEVHSTQSVDDEAVIGLKKIRLAQSPMPGEFITISAHEVLAMLKEQGVNTDEVAYALPRMMKVERAGRQVTELELTNAIQNFIVRNQLSTQIKKVEYPQPVVVGSGDVTLAVQSSTPILGGQRSFQVAAMQNGQVQKTFSVPAMVQEFRELPIARKSLSKGALITEADIQMARFNVESLPNDALQSSDSIIGQEAKSEIQGGELFRANRLAPPIVVTAGSPVTMKFQGEFFEATASGVALESGGIGQEINIRNDASKKIIGGKIIEPGVVSVK